MGRRRSNEYFSMGAAARLGHVVKIRCGGCARTTYFLAADLAKVYGEDVWALNPPIDCSRCNHDTWIRVDTFTPELGDYGHLVIRRPGPVKVIQTWRNEKLGTLIDTFRPGGVDDDPASDL